jgi:hypothetical protein
MPPKPCAAGCVRPQAPSLHRAPRSYRSEPYGAVSLAQHGHLPLISDTTRRYGLWLRMARVRAPSVPL